MKYKQYPEALDMLNSYNANKPGDKEVLYAIALADFNTNKLSETVHILDVMIENTRNADPEWLLLKARAKHRLNEFTEAIRLYKQSIQVLPKTDSRRALLKDQIRRCATGLILERYRENVQVENLGDQVNTIYDEYAPLLSPNYDTKLYFTAAKPASSGNKRNDEGLSDALQGHYRGDMFAGYLQNGSWGNTESLSYLLNGPKSERILGFTNKGTILYFLRGFTEFSGDILVDTFKKNNDQIINPQYFESPLNPELGDNELSFINDSIIVFSSARAGGFGGKDLYISVRTIKGWTKATNLGPTVNSAYDEISPFLARNGKTLYFSSNSLNSIGGFDVFRVDYDPKIFSWSKPQNMGIPVNSADDDCYFKLNQDGHYGYFSSDRPASYGKRDIFSAYYSTELPCQQYDHQLPPAFLPEFVNYENIEKKPEAVQAETPKATEKASYTVKTGPVYYEDDYNILTGQNIQQLDKLAELMILYPVIQAVVSCHTVESDNPVIESYLTLKRAEQVTDYLVKKGVNLKQVIARGCGYNYPLISSDLKGKDKNSKSKLNKRLDIQLVHTKEAEVTVEYESPGLSAGLLNEKAVWYKALQSGLSYRVQFAATRQAYNGTQLTGFKDIIIEKRPSADLNFYMVGLATGYDQIQEILGSVIQAGKTDAFIMAYIDGWPVNKSQAQAYKDQYPDLSKYIMGR